MHLTLTNFKGITTIFTLYSVYSLIFLIRDLNNPIIQAHIKLLDLNNFVCYICILRKSYIQRLDISFPNCFELFMTIISALFSLVFKLQEFNRSYMSTIRIILNYIFVVQMFLCLIVNSCIFIMMTIRKPSVKPRDIYLEIDNLMNNKTK